jgi:hypothetical protein
MGDKEESIWNFGGKARMKETTRKTLDVVERIILSCVECDYSLGLDW